MRFPEHLNVQTDALSERPGLSEGQFDHLRAFIYDRTGIYFQDNKQYLLESRVGRRLSALNLADFEAYLQFLDQPHGLRELPALINEITINETYFFRNPAQFDLLETKLLPELAEARLQTETPRVRLWSTAASTGDEPYTLALLINERLQPRYPGIQFEIVGTDINTDVLEIAQTGTFSAYAVRNAPQAYLRKYFRQEDDRYHLDPEVRRLVTFKHLNLMDRSAMMAMRNFDVILCANVLIYFNHASKQQVLHSLYQSLTPDGYLFVGFSETLYGMTQAFQAARFDKTIAYQRGDRHA